LIHSFGVHCISTKRGAKFISAMKWSHNAHCEERSLANKNYSDLPRQSLCSRGSQISSSCFNLKCAVFFVRKHTYIYIIGEVTRACLRCNIVFSTAPSILSLSICGRSPCQSGNLKLNSFPYLKDLYPSGLLETQWPSHYCAFAPMQFH
jgi:hypothetical protein